MYISLFIRKIPSMPISNAISIVDAPNRRQLLHYWLNSLMLMVLQEGNFTAVKLHIKVQNMNALERRHITEKMVRVTFQMALQEGN